MDNGGIDPEKADQKAKKSVDRRGATNFLVSMQ
jgi:hypothetical protein